MLRLRSEIQESVGFLPRVPHTNNLARQVFEIESNLYNFRVHLAGWARKESRASLASK